MVRVSDVNGPRGGMDKRCHLEVNAAGVGLLCVAGVHARPLPRRRPGRRPPAADKLSREWQVRSRASPAGVSASGLPKLTLISAKLTQLEPDLS
jgi:hypothetical protein